MYCLKDSIEEILHEIPKPAVPESDSQLFNQSFFCIKERLKHMRRKMRA